jgi:hypothetical protein
MDNETLVDDRVEVSEKLVRLLDREGFRLHGAFWILRTDDDRWHLMIVTPLVDEIGPLETYKRVQSILMANKDLDIELSDLVAASPHDPLPERIRLVARTRKNAIERIRLYESSLAGKGRGALVLRST